MTQDFSQLEGEQRLKAENDFMKMKLMLEKGAQFGIRSDEEEIDPGIENQFLRNVIEFEKQFDQHKTIKVFDKVGKPDHFKAVAEIPDAEIEKAWEQLYEHLYSHAIDLSVCSPNITARELYRFATEELFDYKMDDVDIPGMIHGFIYDEFYPDPLYDNSRIATEDCINYILDKKHIQWTHHFQSANLRLNNHFPLSIEEFKLLTNRFKDAYDDLQLVSITNNKSVLDNDHCVVTGDYVLAVKNGTDNYEIAGSWEVNFEFKKEMEYWYVTAVRIDKIDF